MSINAIPPPPNRDPLPAHKFNPGAEIENGNYESGSYKDSGALDQPSGPPAIADAEGQQKLLAAQIALAKAYPIVSGRDLLQTFSRPPAMLIEGFIEEGSLTMISGTWGSAKTATLLCLGIAVARGETIAGFVPLMGRRRVLVLALESSPFQYAKQYRRLLAGVGLGIPEELDFHTLPSEADVADPRKAELLYLRIKSGRYHLVLVDTLKAVSTAEENSNEQMAKVMGWLVSLCAAGMTVIFTHHTVKPGSKGGRDPRYDSRGASAIPAYCDAEWRAKVEEGQEVTLECMKSRGGIDSDGERRFRLEWDTECIRLIPEGDELSLDKIIRANLVSAGVKGMVKKELLEVAILSFSEVKHGALDQRLERVLSRFKKVGKVSHEGQGAPYVWLS